MIYYSVIYPDPLSLRPKENAPFVRILARDGSVITERGGGDDYVPLDLLPRYVSDAVIATEDQRFYDHHGVDPWAWCARRSSICAKGRTVQGGSTLTQQLAKNLYLSSDRTFARKLEEFTLALWLESRLSKSDILELYLNRVYLGSGAYGIDAAARRYFGKPARNLTLGEAAMIAGLLKAPSKYSPLANPGIARARARLVLSQMQEAGFITEDDERKAADEVSRSFDHSERAGAGRCRLRRRLRHGAAGARLRDGRRGRCRRAHRRDDARSQRAGERLRHRRAVHRLARAGAGDERGGGGGARSRRRLAGDGRRAQLRRDAVQPRRESGAPAGLGLQAVRLPRGAGGRLHARQRRRGSADQRRRLGAAQRQRRISRADADAHGAGQVGECGGGAADVAGGAGARGRKLPSAWASARRLPRTQRSRSAPRRFRCSS